MNSLLQSPVIALIFLLTTSATAHNTMIMPGDGAIMTKIEAEEPLKLNKKNLTLDYGFSRYQSLMLCGYLGYGEIKIQGFSEKQWKALQLAIHRCTNAREELYPNRRKTLEQLEREAIEAEDLATSEAEQTAAFKKIELVASQLRDLKSKSIYIQIFDADTQFAAKNHEGDFYQSLRPGLRYNETIFSRERKYRKHATYGINLSAETLVYEWWNCSKATPIALTNEQAFEGAFDAKNPPAQAEASTVCFVVLVGPDPLPYANAENKFGYYVVRPDGSMEAYAFESEMPQKDIASYPMRLPKEDD